ncbi:hypothetical protein [Paenibacillus sp. VMFN-D1]|uniref:hypothetical protein n=1 Tax=Paenibacillus sp. VMFN-D1 TaxID=2135608 RepID=UPI000E254AFD|nr:hypothetical protein [Paenibacillus sp. VMFN-D1]RED32413.1 hypothetical protein C7820_5693 [Paenibacillus sp. VMFN-D1]
MSLERIVVVDGPFFDAQDYELRQAFLLTPDLALYYDGGRLILRAVQQFNGVGEHTHLYISCELGESVRVALDEEERMETVVKVARKLLSMSALDFLIDCVMHDPDAVDEFGVIR